MSGLFPNRCLNKIMFKPTNYKYLQDNCILCSFLTMLKFLSLMSDRLGNSDYIIICFIIECYLGKYLEGKYT